MAEPNILFLNVRAAYLELDRCLDTLAKTLKPAYADDIRDVRRNIGDEIDTVSAAMRGQRDYEQEVSRG